MHVNVQNCTWFIKIFSAAKGGGIVREEERRLKKKKNKIGGPLCFFKSSSTIRTDLYICRQV